MSMWSGAKRSKPQLTTFICIGLLPISMSWSRSRGIRVFSENCCNVNPSASRIDRKAFAVMRTAFGTGPEHTPTANAIRNDLPYAENAHLFVRQLPLICGYK
jgi:hypothetical protein